MEESLARRNFLKRITAVIYGAVTFLAGLPLISFFVSPAFKKTEHEWIELGPAANFSSATPTAANYTRVLKDGWNERALNSTAWVFSSDGGIIVLSPICTHLGCSVSFDKQTDSFACPCHGGRYSRTGEVIGGPPPKPLNRHKIRLTGGNLLIGELEEQATGTA